MKYVPSSVTTILALLLAFVQAQDSSDLPIPCCSVPASSIPSNDRSNWCSANQNTCSELCNGSVRVNQCDSNSLDFTCTCTSGQDVSSSLAQYQQTVPSLMCLTWYSACIAAAGSSVQAQSACTSTRDAQCGNKDVAQAITTSVITSIASRNSGPQQSATKSGGDPSSTKSQAAAGSAPPSSITSSLTPSPTSTPPFTPEDPGGKSVGTGAIAGIVVGVVLGIIIVVVLLVLCRRRRKWKHTRYATGSLHDEKEVATTTVRPNKPELDGHPIAPVELFAGSLHQSHPAELPVRESEQELDGATAASAYQQVYQEETYRDRAPAAGMIEKQDFVSEAPVQGVLDAGTSAPDISTLEEEERRIDAEMAEVQRMKDLREQKYAIQRKLREAKGCGG